MSVSALTAPGSHLAPVSPQLLAHGIRRHNRALVLRTLMREATASRADLARITGLTRPTVSDVVKNLLDDGVIVETGERHVSRPGKPAVMLEFDHDAAQIVAVDLSDPRRAVGALVGTDGTIAHRMTGDGATTSDTAVGTASALADALAALSSRPLLGVGVAAPVDGWDPHPTDDLTARLTAAVGLAARAPVQVHADADLAAHAEHRFAAADDDAGFLLVRIGACTATTVVNGDLGPDGVTAPARELAHLRVGDTPGPRCRCGQLGCVHGWIGEALSSSPEDPVRATAARHLGTALAAITSALDLPRIVLSGPVDELFCAAVGAAVVGSTRTAYLPTTATVVHLAQVEDAVLRGAASRVLAAELGLA